MDTQVTKITKLYLTALLVPANFYSYSPIVATLWKYYNTYENDTVPEFTLHMEESFYRLNVREKLDHYLIFGAIMVPISFLCALVGTAKLVLILSLIKYCTIYFQLVKVKLEEVGRSQNYASDIRSAIQMHQSALSCADLLHDITAPIMLLQLVLCIMVWSSMLLYFTVAVKCNRLILISQIFQSPLTSSLTSRDLTHSLLVCLYCSCSTQPKRLDIATWVINFQTR